MARRGKFLLSDVCCLIECKHQLRLRWLDINHVYCPPINMWLRLRPAARARNKIWSSRVNISHHSSDMDREHYQYWDTGNTVGNYARNRFGKTARYLLQLNWGPEIMVKVFNHKMSQEEQRYSPCDPLLVNWAGGWCLLLSKHETIRVQANIMGDFTFCSTFSISDLMLTDKIRRLLTQEL